VDAGVGQGDRITPYYDSMIAKLIVWDETRELALSRMGGALEQLRIVGVANNVAFLSRLVASPAFADADLDTGLIERQHDFLFPEPLAPRPERWLAAAAASLLRSRPAQSDTPWLAQDGWRLGERAQRPLVLRSGDLEKTLQIQYLAEGWRIQVDDRTYTVRGRLEGTELILDINSSRTQATVVQSAGSEHVFMSAGHAAFTPIDPLTTTPAATANPSGLRSPMPGRVIELVATPGAQLAKGQPLLVLEAMKIEHTITAPGPGTLRAFKVTAGEQVGEGAELVDFVSAPPP
jgi:3-methylcrotonyl-CoA carboxylase alpha subunit